MRPSDDLFDDGQMQDFIARGYAVVGLRLPPDFHRALCGRLERDGSPDDHVLEKLPVVHEVLGDPRLVGALDSILGRGYALERPRYAHSCAPDTTRDGEYWHQDYVLAGRFRHHRPRALNVFYYPQAVTDADGPTAVLPGSQYYMNRPDDVDEVCLYCDAGAVVIMHYDLWHQGRPNHGDRWRHMMRFVFARREEPQGPSWRAENPTWRLPRGAGLRDKSVRRDVWRWYHGDRPADVELDPRVSRREVGSLVAALADQSPAVRRAAADDLAFAPSDHGEAGPALAAAALGDQDEGVRLDAAYALARFGEAAVPVMIEALRAEAEAAWRPNLCRQATVDSRGNADFTNPSQLVMPQALAALGRVAVPVLSRVLRQDGEAARAAAAITLACMGRAARDATAALLEALDDESEWVRRDATEALENMGPLAGTTAAAVAAAARHFELDVVRTCVGWYLGESLTYEGLQALIGERGLVVQKAEIVRWVQQHAATAASSARPERDSVAWRIDEHHGEICGRETYLYRAIGTEGRTLDFFMTELRGSMRAKAFFRNALGSPGGR